MNDLVKTLQVWGLLIGACLLLSACKSTVNLQNDDLLTIFVGTNTDDESEGIYTFSFDQLTGKASFLNKYGGILNPGYLTISDDGKTLFAAHSLPDQSTGQISAFNILPSYDLQFINRQSTGGDGVCYVSTDPMSGDVLAANYSSGSVCLLPLNGDGSLDPASSVIQHKGHSINKDRQHSPHAHYVAVGPGGIIYAVDLGMDKVLLYNKYGGQLSTYEPAYFKSDLGAGPRHIAFHPNQEFIYLLNELAGSVSVFQLDQLSNSYSKLQSISSLPDGFEGFNKSADIHIHPSSRFLYASNRGDSNSIAIYSIQPETGRLTLVDIEDEGVSWPRNFAISPNGQYLLCANRDDDSITVYQLDQETGKLLMTKAKIKVPKPICVKFTHN